MDNLDILDQYEPPKEREEIPAGTYHVGVDKLEIKKTEGGDLRLAATYRILDGGEFQGRNIWGSYMLSGGGAFMGARFLKSVDVDCRTGWGPLKAAFPRLLKMRADAELSYTESTKRPGQKFSDVQIIRVHGWDYDPEEAPVGPPPSSGVDSSANDAPPF